MGNIVVELVKGNINFLSSHNFSILYLLKKTSRPTLANLKSVKQKWLIL